MYIKQQLILISLEPDENIEVGDKVYSSETNSILTFNNETACKLANQQKAKTYFKLIATQDQLPPEYIQQFKVEDVYIEMENVKIEVPKLTNGFVTIKELPLFTRAEVVKFLNEYKSHAIETYLGKNDDSPEEWFNKQTQ